MKKTLVSSLIICLLFTCPLNAQGLLKKVTKSMTDELLGTKSNKKSNQPEPSCACEQPEVTMDMGGKLQLDYSELTISISDDGRILAQDRYSKEYYIVQNGATTGPLKSGDNRLKGFENIMKDEGTAEKNIWANNEYITRSGDKYLINFGGKSYGPYAQISDFVVSSSKDKFASFVIENIAVNATQGKQMEEAMKNAKTDQERMELALQFGQQMANSVMQAGGPSSTQPRLVTNIPETTFDPMNTLGGKLNAKIKYDEILVSAYDKILDLKGNTIITIKKEHLGSPEIFVNPSNTKYAVTGYGTLNFSDGITLAELFNPHLVKMDGKIYLAYMYYSPKKNSIMQCKILF
jgi:hypothetical protein